MSMEIKVNKLYTFNVCIDFILSEPHLTWKTNPVTTQANVYWIFFFFFLAALGLRCSARASHFGGFSCCGARALGARASVAVVHGLSRSMAGFLVNKTGFQNPYYWVNYNFI